ncbi:MAG: TIM barrel protein [Candidatus Pacearchaeota archaeon]
MEINFGPAGIGGKNEAIKNLEMYKKHGLKAAEVEFTYGIYLNNEDAKKIGMVAKNLGISLSIHAPYYINLNSEDKKKQEASKKRILESCERAHYLNAKYVTFHAAFYGKNKEECYDIVKKSILEMQQVIKKNNWKVILAPETTGKPSQFGSLQELLRLMQETKCFFTLDFAHLKAREGKINYDEIFKLVKKARIQELHCHFSGIEYSNKGEKKHIVTSEKEWRELLLNFKKHRLNACIINESPKPLEDSIKGLKIWKDMVSLKKSDLFN